MRVIILAAGKGTRLRPLTLDRPKCMVELEGMPLIKHQLDLLEKFEIKDVNIVTGYLEEKIQFSKVKKFYNPRFDTTNMVSTLFCADELFDGEDDILVSYGDIIYNTKVLKALIKSNEQLNVVVDQNWRRYWEARMVDPLQDVETLKIGKDGYIKELGKKPNTYDDIEGQYIGLIKIRKDVVEQIKNYYYNLNQTDTYDGKTFDNMYMTSFLQMISNNIIPLSPVYIKGGWIEVDEPTDLKFAHFLDLL
jgi:L-glutamine-phosphate cytidylyltransferase